MRFKRLMPRLVSFASLTTSSAAKTVIITRHGRTIARIVPEQQRRQEEIDQAIETLQALRRRTGKIPLEELLSARHEGFKY